MFAEMSEHLRNVREKLPEICTHNKKNEDILHENVHKESKEAHIYSGGGEGGVNEPRLKVRSIDISLPNSKKRE